jgi:hypothetical protein
MPQKVLAIMNGIILGMVCLWLAKFAKKVVISFSVAGQGYSLE